jgi:hypothetical protein
VSRVLGVGAGAAEEEVHHPREHHPSKSKCAKYLGGLLLKSPRRTGFSQTSVDNPPGLLSSLQRREDGFSRAFGPGANIRKDLKNILTPIAEKDAE